MTPRVRSAAVWHFKGISVLLSVTHLKKMIVEHSEDWWGTKSPSRDQPEESVSSSEWVGGWVGGGGSLYFVWPFQNDSEDFGAICALRVPLIPLLLHSAVMGTLNLCNMLPVLVTHTLTYTGTHPFLCCCFHWNTSHISPFAFFLLLLALVSLCSSVIYS